MVSTNIGNLSTQTRWSDGSAYQACGELNQLLLGDSNRLRYKFIADNVTNYFSVVEDERQRRAEDGSESDCFWGFVNVFRHSDFCDPVWPSANKMETPANQVRLATMRSEGKTTMKPIR